MELIKLPYDLTICKLKSVNDIDLKSDFYFIGKTDEEISLVCVSASTPQSTVAREDGWRGFKIQGVLDFSLVGILSEISAVLSENEISIFAVSTYNTDYILVKEDNFDKAVKALIKSGYTVE